MNDESKTPSNDADPERGLATPDILKRWLAFETMNLRHAALIAHGARAQKRKAWVSTTRISKRWRTPVTC